MTMKLDKRSGEDLNRCRPGTGVLFMKVAKDDVRAIEFYPSINGRLRTAPPPSSEDLHEWTDSRLQESQEKGASK